MREIKFRGKLIDNGEWVYGSLINNAFFKNADKSACCYILDTDKLEYDCWEDIAEYIDDFEVIPETIGQYTGHQLKGADLYEGDVIRVEEDAETNAPEDVMNWYVVVWVEEWCMFAMLHTQNEYFQYLKDGKAELDEFLFWTFPIVQTNDSPEKYFLCGNIYDNKELLNPQQ